MTLRDKNLLFLYSLPTDLLPFLFSFLSPKELCSLDSAILNHTDRPLFLSALIQRFTNTKSELICDTESCESKARWYLCRCIPVTTLSLSEVPCPAGVISMNYKCLQEIKIRMTTLAEEDALALCQCLNLKRLEFSSSLLLSNFDLASIIQNLANLEDLALSGVAFSRVTAEMISQHCRSLKCINLSIVEGLGDDELRVLVEGCPSLRSLRLSYLDITEESVRMLRDHRPRISLIGILYCERVRSESVLSLLRETTIPTILNNNDDEELLLFGVDNLAVSIPCHFHPSPEGEIFVTNLLTHDLLLQRLVDLLALRNGVRQSLIDFFRRVVHKSNDHDRLMVAVGVVPVLLRDFDSFCEGEIFSSLSFLNDLCSKTNLQHHLLTSGVLSLYRPHRLQVLAVSESQLLSLPLIVSQRYFVRVLVSLSPHIPQSVVPIEDWISTVSFLIARCSKESPRQHKLHSVIHSICLACTSPSHVRRLVDEGILGYWEGVKRSGEGKGGGDAEGEGGESEVGIRVTEAISHLTSIDQELSFGVSNE
jgi:Leucine-rich repeat (LRR) protein